MFWNVLDEPRRILLRRLAADPPLRDCYLAGGTALALFRGHRNSEDFDWFTSRDFVPSDLISALESRVEDLAVDSTAPGTLHGRAGGIRLSWLYYPNPLIEPLHASCDVDGLELASLVDIGLMKWAALADRGARKDFLDLYELMRAGVTLSRLYPLLGRKFPAAKLNAYHLVKCLSYFDDAEDDPWPEMYVPVNWDRLKRFFKSEQAALMGSLLTA